MRAWVLAVAVAVNVAAPRVARADDRQAAGEEFAAGDAADKRRDWRAAIEHYLRAYDLSPHPNALYNVAVDYERIGELREAATYYRRYLDEALDADDRDKVERLVDALQNRKARVAIRTTPPGGQIMIDGTPAGQAPVTRELGGGTHAITAMLGERRNQREITVEYGEPVDVVIELTAASGTLSVTSNVSGASVAIDGAAAGVTPLTVSVPAGDRKVVVTADGYSTLERMVKVPGEGSAQITATLVHPLGYVEPVPPRTRSYVVSFEYARALVANANAIHAGYGYHLLDWEGLFRVGFLGNKTYSYGVQVRRLFGRAKLKPFLDVYGEIGGASDATSTANSVKGLVGGSGGVVFEISAGERLSVDLIAFGGVALFAYDNSDKVLAFPIGATLQLRPGGPTQ